MITNELTLTKTTIKRQNRIQKTKFTDKKT